MYCRHCQRRRNIGESDRHANFEDIAAALQYVARNRKISLMPNHIVEHQPDKVILQTWEGRLVEIENRMQ